MKNNNIDNLFYKYKEALKVLNNKFNNLYNNNLKLGEENPISHIKYRIKTKKSIEHKLKNKNNLDFTAQNIKDNLNDVAGIRIVCPFLSDIKEIVNYVNKDPDIKVIKVKNYIDNPKNNGYSSYHMIVSVPIIINEAIEYVNAEIQIRTMAMDVIASLDHKITYKNNVNFSKEITQKLQNMVYFINMVDTALDNFIQEKKKHITNVAVQENLFTICDKKKVTQLLKKYKIALKTVEETINSIKNECINNGMINPIEHIKGRIKPNDSIILKLKEKKKEITIENIEKYINDIGAIQIVCSFLSDAEEIINKINNQKDFIILDRQDYIKNPKECGYSSYHFIVAIPIEIDDEKNFVKIEIQVRTIIMDFWANVEHILCYKKEADIATKEKLKQIANILQIVDPEIDKVAKIAFNQTNIPNQQKNKEKVKTKKKIKN